MAKRGRPPKLGPATRYSLLPLRDFGRGLVTVRPPTLLEPNEAQVAENVRLTEGFIRRRSGWTPVGTLPEGLEEEPVRGLFRFNAASGVGAADIDEGTEDLVAICGDKFLGLDENGDFEVKETLPFAPPIYPTFAQALDRVYVAAEAQGEAQPLWSYPPEVDVEEPAPPSFPTVNGSASSNHSTQVTNHTVSLPAAIEEGELLIVFFGQGSSSTVTAPAGWTRHSGVSSSSALQVLYRIADGTEGTEIIVNTASARRSAHQAYRIEGADPLNPVSVATASGTSATADPPQLLMEEAQNYLWFAVAAVQNGTVTDDPASYTNFVANASGGSATNVGIGQGRRELNAASENPGTMVNSNQGWVAATVSIRPGLVQSELPGAPSGRVVTFHNFALWVAGGDHENSNRVWWSRQIPNEAIFPVNNYIDITPGDGDKITGLAQLYGALVVLKQRSVARVVGYPPDDAESSDTDLQASTYVYEQPGCIAPRSVDANRNFVVYLNRNGIYGFDGQESQELTERIRPLFEQLNESLLPYAVGQFVSEHHYICSVPTESSSDPNLVISLYLGEPHPHITLWRGYPQTDLDDGFTTHSLKVHSIATYAFDDGRTIPVLGLVGQVGKMDGSPTDNGERILWRLRTGTLPMGEGRKVIRRGWLSVGPKTGALNLSFLPDYAQAGVTPVTLTPRPVTETDERAEILHVPAAGAARNWSVEIWGEGTDHEPEVYDLTLEFFNKDRN